MKQITKLIVGILILTLSACGPSPEQIATMTASAWTPTPPPTATPTPVPYDVNVSIVDANGAPISEASITFPESGNGSPVKSDAQGKFSWKNLAGESANLSVSAQGYLSAQQAATLQRGVNEISITLTRDPFGLLPSEACAAGEKLLYAEDFQDSKAQGWQNITAATDFAVSNGWAIAPSADGNMELMFSTKTAIDNGDRLPDYAFDNAVWRLKVKVTGTTGFSFLNWKHKPVEGGGESRYVVQIGGGNIFVDLSRLQMPDVGHFSVGRSNLQMKQDVWYYFEVSAFNGQIQLWADGKKLTEYQDPKPLPVGSIGLEVHAQKDGDLVFTYDDFSVCELSAPFISIAPAAP